MTEPEIYISNGIPPGAMCQLCRKAPAVATLRIEFPGVVDNIRVCANCLKVRMITLVTEESNFWMRIIWKGGKLMEEPVGSGMLEVNCNGRRED